MSPNNVILVAHTADRSYVLADLDADAEWNEEHARKAVAEPSRKFCIKRGRALLLAHDIQNRIKTEYGVREMFLEPRARRGAADEDPPSASKSAPRRGAGAVARAPATAEDAPPTAASKRPRTRSSRSQTADAAASTTEDEEE